MKHTQLLTEEWRLYGDAAFSLLTFPWVVAVMYWLLRSG
jgi:hypothetical protein